MPRPGPLRRAASISWRYVWSLGFALGHRRTFSEVASYCQFVGYPRSGHTLVYALLNAHPEIALSNELGALRWLDMGFSRDQLYSLILRADRRFAARGYRFQGYEYRVGNQWQGRYRRLLVIGDKDGGRDTTRLGEDPDRLRRLVDQVGVPVRIIHVVRNPYDVITTIARRRTERGEPSSLEDIVGQSGQALSTVDRVLRESPDAMALTVRHEDLIQEPRPVLRRLCSHVGVEPGEEYLEECSRIVFPSARKSRDSVKWTPRLVDRVRAESIDRFDFLAGYTFES